LTQRGIEFQSQVELPIVYKGHPLDSEMRLDIVLPGKLIVELKAVEQIHPLHEAQHLSYMKLAQIRLGLLINFKVVLLKDGIKRMIL